MTKIAGVLNGLQSRNSYVMSSIASLSTWDLRIKSNTKSLEPVLLDIKVNDDAGWSYTTNGHFIATCGYDGRTLGNESVQIADPHPTYYGKYWYSNDSLYSVNQAHFRQSMIW